MKTSKDFSEIKEAADLLAGILHPSKAAAVVEDERKPPSPSEAPQAEFRGDRLENALSVMCRRGNFIGAVVADSNGLPLAVFNSPVSTNAIAAFTTVLGTAIERASSLLEQDSADNISMDINYTDKVVLKRFDIEGRQYYLMVICPQNTDEREEVELSIEQIVSILA